MAQTSTSPRGHVERLCAEFGYRYIHSGNEPDLIAGVGTYAVEIIEDLPDVEVIFVPVGGGSGACGTAIAAKTINPAIQVIAVGAAKAPAAYLSWKSGKLVEATMETAAEGLATRTAFEMPQSIMRDMLDDFCRSARKRSRMRFSCYSKRPAPWPRVRARRPWRAHCRSRTKSGARRWRL